MARTSLKLVALSFLMTVVLSSSVQSQIVVRGERIYTCAGPVIENGVVVVRDGKISSVGRAADIAIPQGYRVLEAQVVTPGLIDARTVVGIAGYYNQSQDQDQLEKSAPIQPELRAIDAYNPRERLVDWVRGFGVTTLHTGHAPGELISGQSIIVKTTGNTVEAALVRDNAALMATLAQSAKKAGKQSPGTRGKMLALLRAELIKGREYLEKRAASDEEKRPPRDLRLEALGQVLNREIPLVVTAHRAQDIASALRLAREFELRLILDGGAECYLLIDELKSASVPVILHPTMQRAYGETENLSLATAAKLKAAGILFAIQSGYESYVPKTRVVLFEAGVAAAYGLRVEDALAAITIDAAKILGLDQRLGSISVGKDGDLALYDGDPFEYTSHCIGTIIGGEVVSEQER